MTIDSDNLKTSGLYTHDELDENFKYLGQIQDQNISFSARLRTLGELFSVLDDLGEKALNDLEPNATENEIQQGEETEPRRFSPKVINDATMNILNAAVISASGGYSAKKLIDNVHGLSCYQYGAFKFFVYEHVFTHYYANVSFQDGFNSRSNAFQYNSSTAWAAYSSMSSYLEFVFPLKTPQQVADEGIYSTYFDYINAETAIEDEFYYFSGVSKGDNTFFYDYNFSVNNDIDEPTIGNLEWVLNLNAYAKVLYDDTYVPPPENTTSNTVRRSDLDNHYLGVFAMSVNHDKLLSDIADSQPAPDSPTGLGYPLTHTAHLDDEFVNMIGTYISPDINTYLTDSALSLITEVSTSYVDSSLFGAPPGTLIGNSTKPIIDHPSSLQSFLPNHYMSNVVKSLFVGEEKLFDLYKRNVISSVVSFAEIESIIPTLENTSYNFSIFIHPVDPETGEIIKFTGGQSIPTTSTNGDPYEEAMFFEYGEDGGEVSIIDLNSYHNDQTVPYTGASFYNQDQSTFGFSLCTYGDGKIVLSKLIFDELGGSTLIDPDPITLLDINKIVEGDRPLYDKFAITVTFSAGSSSQETALPITNSSLEMSTTVLLDDLNNIFIQTASPASPEPILQLGL